MSDVKGNKVHLKLANGEEVSADVVVEAAGDEPRADLAERAGLELHRGAVLVNAELRARDRVWAAGDAASWHDVTLGTGIWK